MSYQRTTGTAEVGKYLNPRTVCPECKATIGTRRGRGGPALFIAYHKTAAGWRTCPGAGKRVQS